MITGAYILVLSWKVLFVYSSTRYFNDTITVAYFEDKEACLSAGNKLLKDIAAINMKATCFPAASKLIKEGK